MTAMISERKLQRTYNKSTPNTDRVHAELTAISEKTGSSEVYITMDDLGGRLGISGSTAYQAVYRLWKKGYLETIKETRNGLPPHVAGVKLFKAANEITITEIAVTKAKEKTERMAKGIGKFETIETYMNKREAIEQAKKLLVDAGLEEAIIVKFEADPIGEEALVILKELVDTRKELLDAKIDLMAAQRKIEMYERRYGEMREPTVAS